MKWFPELLQGLARRLAGRVIRAYYPTIEVTGAERIPATGAVLLAANHPNSIIDPVLVSLAAGRQVHYLAKAPLFQIPVVGQVLYALGMLPVHRASDDPAKVHQNIACLAAAVEQLKAGEAVGIFPEGKSHDLTRVEQVRTGAARIAFQAAGEGVASLQLVPLGLNYEQKERFRSAVWVQVGEVIEVAASRPANPADERAAVRVLSSELDAALRKVVIHLEEESWESLLQDLEVLHPPPRESRRHPIARLRHRKRLAEAINHFYAAERPRAEALTRELQEHQRALTAAGLTARSAVLRRRGWSLTGRLLVEALVMNLGFVLVLIGTLHHLLPFVVTRAVARWTQAPGRSTIALARIGVGLPVYGAYYAAVGWWMAHYFLLWVALAWLLPMPLAGLLALQYWRRVRRTSPHWWRELGLLCRRTTLRKLRENQQHLQEQLAALGEEYAAVRPREPLPTNLFSWRRLFGGVLRWGLALCLVGVVLIYLSFYVPWRRPAELPELAATPPALATLAPEDLRAMLDSDEGTAAQAINALAKLQAQVTQLRLDFESGRRDFYRQADDDLIRQAMLSYLSCRTTLLGFVWKYQKHDALNDSRLRLRAFLTQAASAIALADASLHMVLEFRGHAAAVRKLNEAEPIWGVPPGLFENVKQNLISKRTRDFLGRAQQAWSDAQPEFERRQLRSNEPYATMHEAIRRHLNSKLDVSPLVMEAAAVGPLVEAGKIGKAALYEGQAFVSTWLGRTRFRAPRDGRPMIQTAQLEEVRGKLKPGDILLERQNWFLSRAFMPGFWAHAALYIGNSNDWVRLGLPQDARVAAHWKRACVRERSGHEQVVLEAVPQGVRLTTLEHCLGVADAAAVLRPHVDESAVREAIARAFSHLGKPYDFDFDFFSTDRLVCTELVYRCYDGAVQLSLVNVMGRKTLPPTELVRKFANERGRPGAQLECVCFLDGDEIRGVASFRGEEVLVTTLERPGLMVFPALAKE
jgi:1-acyl-sn-glycerol-3-phosphate acyltransferase